MLSLLGLIVIKTPIKEKFYVEEYGVGSGRTFFEEILMCIEMCGTDSKLLKSHNMLCLMICAYCDKPNDGVLFSKEEVNSKLKELDLDDFISWVASHYDLNRPGGHINGFYPDKVIKMLTRAGFKEAREESFRESRFEEVKTNENLDLLLRKNISLYVEAIK